MSILDSVSEHQHYVVGIVSLSEVELRKQYEELSEVFWDNPTRDMTISLDKLLEVIEDVKAWRLDMVEAMKDPGDA